ncbi:MAG: hypothetical protein IPL33_17260 [Sphingobacteriales bacterium]|nr:hypothetical protein [Sphingobacteriales bacterium]
MSCVSFPILRASDWENSHNRRQRPHSRRMPSRVRFARISRTPLDASYGRLCIVGGGFRLDTQQFYLLRRAKPFHLKVSNPFAILCLVLSEDKIIT